MKRLSPSKFLSMSHFGQRGYLSSLLPLSSTPPPALVQLPKLSLAISLCRRNIHYSYVQFYPGTKDFLEALRHTLTIGASNVVYDDSYGINQLTWVDMEGKLDYWVTERFCSPEEMGGEHAVLMDRMESKFRFNPEVGVLVPGAERTMLLESVSVTKNPPMIINNALPNKSHSPKIELQHVSQLEKNPAPPVLTSSTKTSPVQGVSVKESELTSTATTNSQPEMNNSPAINSQGSPDLEKDTAPQASTSSAETSPTVSPRNSWATTSISTETAASQPCSPELSKEEMTTATTMEWLHQTVK